MRALIFAVVAILAFCSSSFAFGPIAKDSTGGEWFQSIAPIRNSTTGLTWARCDTVSASGTATYSVVNTTAISFTATDASYNGVTVKRYWDSDSTAYMPIFTSRVDVPGPGISTVTVVNVTSSNAIICIERMVFGETP